mmetsp:Transcript_80521/g.207255  ORF Transcript_80521/g.207255 Transcript_80521/m.207255 type:complete len:201 (-) Transcript_80521:46-648(-)
MDASLPQRVPEGVGHLGLLDAELAKVGFGAQVLLDPRVLVDAVEELRGVLACPGHDRHPAARMAVQELRQVVDLAVQGHPAVLRHVVAPHLRQGDALREERALRLVQQLGLARRQGGGRAAVRRAVMEQPDVCLQRDLLHEDLAAVTASEEDGGRGILCIGRLALEERRVARRVHVVHSVNIVFRHRCACISCLANSWNA